MTRPVWIDPIVEEVRKQSRAYTAQFGHDIHLICEDLRRKAAGGESAMGSLSKAKKKRRPAGLSKAGRRRAKKAS